MRISRFDFDLERAGGSDPWTVWFTGFVIPLCLAAYAISVVAAGHVTLIGARGRTSVVYGWDAIPVSVAAIGLALLLHARHFWPGTQRLENFSPLGQFCGLFTFTVALLWLSGRILTSL